MFCKFCGESIEDDAIFCSKCGAKVKETADNSTAASYDESAKRVEKESFLQKTKKGMAYVRNKISPKAENIFDKICFSGMILGVLGIVIFITMVIISLVIHGVVNLFDENYIYVLTIISIVFMLIGFCSTIAKICLYFIFKTGKFPIAIFKRCMVMGLACVCLGFSIWGFANINSNNFSYDYDYSYTSGISSSQAISYAKNSRQVQNEIANLYKMEFYYTPDWGKATATKNSDGKWTVTIKGTISGYTDEYKSDFIYDKKFKVIVTVYSSGIVGSIKASKW